MGHTIPASVTVVLATLMLTSGSMASNDEHRFSCEPDTWIENPDVRVWFQGLKGHIKVFDQNRSDPNGGLYTYKTVQMVELRGDEVVASLDLSRALPHNSICRIWDTDEGVELVYHVGDQVRAAAGGIVGPTGVTFHYKLSEDGQGAKFDVFVNEWPWSADDTELAFDFELHSPFGFDVAENGVGFHGRDGEPNGYVDWAETARVFYEDEREDESIVDAETDARPNSVSIRLRYSEVEAGFNDLDYDPWVGTGGYEIRDGRIYGDDWLDRQIPATLRPVYNIVDDAL